MANDLQNNMYNEYTSYKIYFFLLLELIYYWILTWTLNALKRVSTEIRLVPPVAFEVCFY